MSTDANVESRQFLVGSVRAYLAGEPPPVTLGLAPVDWEAFTRLAEFHCVAPLLARALRDGDAPDAAREALAAAARANANRSLLLTGELARLLNHLDAQGIAAIPWKGPTLSAWLYGDPALRQYHDLDVLARPQEFAAAQQVILSLGYQPAGLLTHHAAFLLSRGQREVRLELHRNIAPEDFPLRLDFEGMWARRIPFSLGGAPMTRLAPEDLLLLLCVHGGRHMWLRLQWLCDVAQLMRCCSSLDWDRAVEQARSAGGRRALLLGLALAHDILDAPWPPEVEQAARRDALTAKLAAQVTWRLFEGPLQLFKPWKRKHFGLQLIDRAWDRFTYTPRYWFAQMTTPTPDDRSAFRLPAALAPLYGVLRPLRLVGKYARRVLTGFYRQRK